ncbi:50S ribosomal protein L29 [bacterium]|jgi:large subunit ribosomal protein L29|nr:50S ribosomal protein L29 [bacterium]
MKNQEIRKLGMEDLQKKLDESRKELFNLRFQHAVGQLENKARLRSKRREIARILTILSENRGA